MGNVYGNRREIIVNALAKDFADHLDVIPSVAGMHVSAVARPATAERIDSVVRRAADASVAVRQLSVCAVASATPTPSHAGIRCHHDDAH